MESTFRGLFLAGVVGGVAWFWYVVLQPMTLLVEAMGMSIATLTVIGLAGWLMLRGQRVLKQPEVAAKVSRAASEAANVSQELSQVSADVLKETGSKLGPMLSYVFGFSGRVSRKEYLIVQVLTGLLTLVLFALFLMEPDSWLGVLSLLAIGAVAAVLLAFGVRRTRDTGVNHWWFLLVLVPPANLALMVFLLLVPTDEFKDAPV
ncbi:DUF805 domain-containing protein [Leisingera aquaemixtae]|uniref:DUF805 domain-containing protein n=1 Tax=Leisingera aquaemixtae TaxID=1396826 RepID=UPI001C95189C|nr:DUF805 domain-containing protein [Leisingera aquaemixtae]MBY6069616.1 DUF805 domain-containing protein [Leisingera aquaemixtae]